MLKFIFKRILSAIPTLFLALTLIFFLIRAIPGNPLYSLVGMGEFVTQDDINSMADQVGLSGTFLQQYITYLKDIFTGNWGDSLFMGMPVFQGIMSRMECTLMLTLLSMLITILVGVPIGILGATNKNTLIDYSASTFSVAFLSIPNFCLGIFLTYLFGFKLKLFPLSNYMSIEKNGFWMACYSLILPAFSIGMTNVANIARYTRAAMISVMQRDYIRTARAKGLPESKVRYRHALKNAFGTVLTVLSGSLLGCLGGSVVVEGVFNLHGVGELAAVALSRRDYPLAQAVVLVMTLMFIVINILLDIGYKLLDPRVELN